MLVFVWIWPIYDVICEQRYIADLSDCQKPAWDIAFI